MNRSALLRLILLLPVVGAVSCGQPVDRGHDAAKAGPRALPSPETLSSRPNAGPGERLYIEKCAMCHGPGGMGAGLLARRMDEPLLEKRKDLDADYVIQAARMGIGNMPAIPRGEVADEEMRQIAAYLARKEATGQ